MPFSPPDQLARAREMDLPTYLRCCEPEELVSTGGNTYATRSHDSLKISNGKWYWWSRGVGGSNALDCLTTVRELPLPEAVQRVLSAAGAPLAEVAHNKVHTTKIFSLPPKHADNRRVFSYLHGRGIDPEIINHCIKHGLLYYVSYSAEYFGIQLQVVRYTFWECTIKPYESSEQVIFKPFFDSPNIHQLQ